MEILHYCAVPVFDCRKNTNMKVEDTPTIIRYLFRTGKGELGQVLRELRIMVFMAILSTLSTVGVFFIAVIVIQDNQIPRIILVLISLTNLLLTALLLREVLRQKRIVTLVMQGKGFLDSLLSPTKSIKDRLT